MALRTDDLLMPDNLIAIFAMLTPATRTIIRNELQSTIEDASKELETETDGANVDKLREINELGHRCLNLIDRCDVEFAELNEPMPPSTSKSTAD